MASPGVAAERTTHPGSAALFAVTAAISATVAALVVGLSAAQALVLLGIPDPGPVTTFGLPALRAIGEGAAIVAIGSLLLSAFLVPPQKSGVLDADGYRSLRIAGNAALVWAGCALLLIPLSISDASGQPLREVLIPRNLWLAFGQVEAAEVWLWTALLALLLVIGCRTVLRWGWTPILLGLGLLTLMPLALTGHSSAGGAHDVATNSLIWHLVGASLWAGGLIAVLLHARRGGAHTDVAASRFSHVATVALIVMVLSGVINALVRIPPGDLFTTTYGRLVLAKAAALVTIGSVGLAQRRKALPALAADPTSRGALIRFAGVEALLFAATVGLAVGLGRTPPPAGSLVEPSRTEVALGYDLAGPPTLARLAFDWRFDLMFGVAAIVLAVVYLLGVRRLVRRGDAWSRGRTASWLLGCLVLLIGTSSGIGRYAPAMFSVHMGVHMALSMLAPILLVLGGPITLGLRALPPAGRNGIPGAREWLLAAVHNPVSSVLTHPLVASFMFVGGFYALYLGGIFDLMVDSHAAHLSMMLHFLISGYLFYWVVIGIDPAPRRVQPVTKLAMVFGSLPFHAFFGVTLMSMTTVMGGAFYRSLGLPWNYDLLEDQRLGGGLAWAAGEVPLVIVMLALLIQWSRSDERAARRMDRLADRDDEAELAAHNAMFAELARRDKEAGL